MQIFHPTAHALHAPAWYLADGVTLPCPESPARLHCVLQTLHSPHQLIPIPPTDNKEMQYPPALAAAHTPAYLHYLQTIHPLWREQFQTDVLPDTFPRNRPLAPPTQPHARAGYYCFDLAAPITAGTWQAALNSACCAIAAAQSLLQSGRGVPYALALSRPPGHHAGPDYCGGFCYLNNIAVAAHHLLLAGQKKVAILDLDYHHGNGTQDIFYHRSDVLFVSLHADPNSQYPYFWGHAHETGAAAGQGFNLNLPLPRNSPASQWFAALDTALDRIQSFAPVSLLVSLGTDIHEQDPVGDFHITTPHFTDIANRIRSLQLPTALFLEGGYNLQTLPQCLAATLQGLQ